MTDTVTEERIVEALERVPDPCSVAANCSMSIIEMGMLVGWHHDEDGHLDVTLCLTAPVCILGPVITRDAEAELLRIGGVSSAKVQIDSDVIWTEQRMSAAGAGRLSSKRRQAMQLTDARPQAWRTAAHPRLAALEHPALDPAVNRLDEPA